MNRRARVCDDKYLWMWLANFADIYCTHIVFGFHYLKVMKYNVHLYNNEIPVICLNSNEMNFKHSDENHLCHMIPVIKVYTQS